MRFNLSLVINSHRFDNNSKRPPNNLLSLERKMQISTFEKI